jgi:hypothetical protein
MSVFQLGTTATDKLFLEYILPGLNVEIRENTTVYDRFKTNSEAVLGKYAIFKCLTGAPKSVRPSSSSTLPTAQQGTYSEFIIYMKRGMYATLQFDRLASACGKGKGAVMDIVKSEVKAIAIQMANKSNRQIWGDGSGRLAQLSAAVSNSTTAYINGPLFGQDSNGYTNPSNYLDEGQLIDVYNSSTGALEAEEIEISTITVGGAGTDTLLLASAITASDDAYLFDHDTYAASQAAGTGVPMGLRGICDTSNPYTGITQTYFQNVNRSANTWAQAQVVDMGSLAITNAKILELIMKCERYGRIDVLITNDIIWRAYYQILETDKTMPNEQAYWGGTTGLAFYGGRAGKIPIIYDTDCPDGDLYALDEDLLEVYAPTQNGLTWIPGENGILTRVQGKDEHTAALVHYNNFGTPKPQAQGRLKSIKHAAS